MVQHMRHNLVGGCHLSEGAGVSCAGGLGLRPAHAGEGTYLYPEHASLPVDPCGQTESLLTCSAPGIHSAVSVQGCTECPALSEARVRGVGRGTDKIMKNAASALWELWLGGGART